MVVTVNEGEGKSIIDALLGQGFNNLRTISEMDYQALPDDITQVDDEGLMELFSQITERSSVVATQLACAIIDETNAEKEYDYESSMAMIRARQGKTTKDTVSLLKSQVSSDPKVKQLADKKTDTYNYRKIVEVMAANLDRELQLVSRELTRRTAGATFRTRSNRSTL